MRKGYTTKNFNGHSKNESILSECLVEGLKLQFHNWKIFVSTAYFWSCTGSIPALQVSQEDVFYVPPTLFKYLQDFHRSGRRLFDGCSLQCAKYIFWSCSISNWHWTCAVHANKAGATVYFMGVNSGKEYICALQTLFDTNTCFLAL